jgi:hypothetical protein
MSAEQLAPLRFSVLKKMSLSPAHARYAMQFPDERDTPAMRLGRLAHACFLGANVPTVFPGDRRGNVWKEFKAAHEGEDIVTAEEFDRCSAMAAALHSHQEARSLLMGKREQTVFFDFAGRPCRATPDAFTPKHLTDLKSTADASPRRFPWTAMRLAYHAQMAWYRDGLVAAGYPAPEELSLVAIEVRPPFAVAVYQMTERAEDFGRRLYRSWLEEFLNCERSGHWPGYPFGTLDAPEDALELVGADGEVLEVNE